LIGSGQIAAFHLNDSKTDLASRVDRHEHIGHGKIGLAAFRHIVNDARFKNTPGCLETPKSEDLHEDAENLATLRSLAPRPRQTARFMDRRTKRLTKPRVMANLGNQRRYARRSKR
jgi:deoxyribonuclease-4